MPDIPFKKEKVLEQLMHLAAQYFQQESGKSSLITITRALADDFLKRVTVLFTVIPESKEKEALEFAIKIAEKGDLVSIFGKGHEKSMNLDSIHEIPWSDQEVVKEVLKNIK